MTDKKNIKDYSSTKRQMPEDSLNARIGVLTRREVEARILAPMVEALGETCGRNEVLKVLRTTIIKIAEKQGAELARRMNGNSLQHFAESLKFWTVDNALQIEVIETSAVAFAFNVTRCRYAELYEQLGIRELGTTLSCARDFALIQGFNPGISLARSQTIMEGAPYCDFRYRLKK